MRRHVGLIRNAHDYLLVNPSSINVISIHVFYPIRNDNAGIPDLDNR
jgi:hypothetical protein